LLHSIIFTTLLIINGGLALEVSGNVFYSSKYLIGDKTNIPDQQAVEHLISGILAKYNNAGFPFCRISPEVIYDADTIQNIVLTVEEGPRVIIEELVFKTDGKTDAHAAKRVANYHVGDYFASREVVSAKKRLVKTKAFQEISDNILERDGKYYLLFALKEKESDFLTLSGSFSGEDFQFGASYSSFSLLGTLRQLIFNYEYQKLFSLKFREPVLIAPAMFDADFAIWTYDSTRQIQGYARFAAPVGSYFSASVLSGIEIVNYYGTDTTVSETSDNLLGAGFGFAQETLIWTNTVDLRLDYLFRDADRLRIEYDSQTELWKVSVGIHYRRVQTDSFGFFDYVRIGGANDLRGYLEDEFLTTRALWLNLEYHRFPVFPLFDIARLADEIVYSFGLGIEARSRFADASLILAWPKNGTWEDGKLHLTFSKGF
jgi:outer membrane protein assembly factor BamA